MIAHGKRRENMLKINGKEKLKRKGKKSVQPEKCDENKKKTHIKSSSSSEKTQVRMNEMDPFRGFAVVPWSVVVLFLFWKLKTQTGKRALACKQKIEN